MDMKDGAPAPLRLRPELAICEHCDSVHQRGPLAPGEAADCRVCGATLYRRSRLDIDAMLALTVAALIVFVLANAAPIVTMQSAGVTTRGWLMTMVASAWSHGVGPVAAIAAGTVFLFPLAQLALYLFVLHAARLPARPKGFGAAMHGLRWLRPWSMVEVFLIGILVSIIKMSSLARVTAEAGLWGFGVLTILLTALSTFELRALWEIHDGR
ncbi:MAG: paraquat-inducible protein A [Gammaproteobacteria bacterium]|jgi:paraquat-inducible protein A|nr:paraquat-inducible protein A [Gammaproteobacteria bacterium]